MSWSVRCRGYRDNWALLLSLLLLCTSSAAAETANDYSVIDTFVAEQMRALAVPGVAIAIVQGERIVHMRGFGVADDAGREVTTETPFRIGSVTKAFTALAIMQLVEQGKVELDAPVQRYLPWFRVADAAESTRITVRHLLNQTSGLSTLSGNGYWDSSEELEPAIRQLATVSLSAPVGERFQYSNVNYTIAGLIVEVVSGVSYADYVARHIFQPLAMRHAHVLAEPSRADGLARGHYYSMGRMFASDGAEPPAYLPAGFIAMSIEDLAHFAMAQLNGGRYGSVALLTREGVAQMHQPGVTIEVPTTDPGHPSYGFGWAISQFHDVATVWHNGDTGRYHAALLMVPEQSLAVVVLTNASGLELMFTMDGIARGVLSRLLGKPDLPPVMPAWQIGLLYWTILLSPLLVVLAIARGWQRWRRGDLAALSIQANRKRQRARRLATMVLPLLLLAALFVFGLPLLTGLPLAALPILFPDLAAAVFLYLALTIGWSLIYTRMVLQAKW